MVCKRQNEESGTGWCASACLLLRLKYRTGIGAAGRAFSGV